MLNQARAFYIDFLLEHADKLSECITYYSVQHLARSRIARCCSVGRKPARWRQPPILVPCLGGISANASHRRRLLARRSVIKDAIGKARSYLSSPANWEKSGKQAIVCSSGHACQIAIGRIRVIGTWRMDGRGG
jgi:hypothetical protein